MADTAPASGDYDVVIIGGGMAGASLALALRDLPLSIAVVENMPLDATGIQPSFDARAIALAAGSCNILQTMGLWQDMAARGTTAIEHVHVSDHGGFGSTRLHAAEERTAALGHVIEARVMGASLHAALRECTHIDLLCPAEFISLQRETDFVRLELRHQGATRSLRTRLLVAADGGRSAVREQLNVRTWEHDYGQTAVIATVGTDRLHGHVAHERFTDTGPLALLPCDPSGDTDRHWHGRRWSLVWTVRNTELDEILALDDRAFLQALQQRFGHRAGRFEKVSPRHAHPLALRFVNKAASERIVFIGNAAHALHPVAGQGFNLGLRDVAMLAEILAATVSRNEDIGSLQVLGEYARLRRPDYLRTALFTDGLVRLYSNRLLPLQIARNLGLLALDILPFARHTLARQAMGLAGRQSRLACRLPVSRIMVTDSRDRG